MATNFIMRLGWTLTISPGSIGIVLNPLVFATMLSTIEIVRRAQWNLFRLENEQLNNVGHFRAVNVIVKLLFSNFSHFYRFHPPIKKASCLLVPIFNKLWENCFVSMTTTNVPLHLLLLASNRQKKILLN
jgi:hypothetical protein